jgi:hypothetical protein
MRNNTAIFYSVTAILSAFFSYIDPYKDPPTDIVQHQQLPCKVANTNVTLSRSPTLQILVHAAVLNLDMQSAPHY